MISPYLRRPLRSLEEVERTSRQAAAVVSVPRQLPTRPSILADDGVREAGPTLARRIDN